MKFRPFHRAPESRSIASLYGAIVAQARAPAFYRIYGVPDTVNGRLEMIMLHAVLLLSRLENEPPAVRELGQGLFDDFCRDMDESMREMGVGDLAVPRKMRRLAEAFYGRQSVYRAALAASGEQSLAAALLRNVFADAPESDGAERLAVYVREAVRRLADQGVERLRRAELSFPDPERLVANGRIGTPIHGEI
jgi:cytochrome b pre-mRNA-processing protein 3